MLRFLSSNKRIAIYSSTYLVVLTFVCYSSRNTLRRLFEAKPSTEKSAEQLNEDFIQKYKARTQIETARNLQQGARLKRHVNKLILDVLTGTFHEASAEYFLRRTCDFVRKEKRNNLFFLNRMRTLEKLSCEAKSVHLSSFKQLLKSMNKLAYELQYPYEAKCQEVRTDMRAQLMAQIRNIQNPVTCNASHWSSISPKIISDKNLIGEKLVLRITKALMHSFFSDTIFDFEGPKTKDWRQVFLPISTCTTNNLVSVKVALGMEQPTEHFTFNDVNALERLQFEVPDWIKSGMKDCVEDLEAWMHGVFTSYVVRTTEQAEKYTSQERQLLTPFYGSIHVNSGTPEKPRSSRAYKALNVQCITKFLGDILRIKDLQIEDLWLSTNDSSAQSALKSEFKIVRRKRWKGAAFSHEATKLLDLYIEMTTLAHSSISVTQSNTLSTISHQLKLATMKTLDSQFSTYAVPTLNKCNS